MIVDFFVNNPQLIKYLIVYFIIMNLTGLLAMAIDKRRAKKGEWRIKEGTLFVITLLGGGLGTIGGMFAFRHKTKKLKFTVGLPTILLVEVILVVYCLIKY